MKITPINNTSFGKFYIKDTDYSSVQSQYLCDISSKLNQKVGKYDSYTQKIEQLGYDICADSAYSQDKIRVYLTKTGKSNNDPTRKLTMATLGEFTTDFHPEIGVITADYCKKTDKIMKYSLLSLATILAMLAAGKACTEKVAKSTTISITNTAKNYINTASNNIKTFKLK